MPVAGTEDIRSAPWWTLAVIGLVGGLLFGALGAGGGIVMVPLLIWCARMGQRQASATSLFAVIPISIAGAITYGAGGQAELAPAAIIAVGGIAGSLLGTRLLRILPVLWLRWLFIVVLLVFSVRLVLTSPERGATVELDLAVAAGLVALGFLTGIAAGLFGIGGGVIIVPVLIAVFGFGDLAAKGTALLAMIPTAATGSAANLRARLVRPRDGLVLGAGSVAGSVGGSFLAFALPARLSVLLFAGLVAVVVAQLIVRAIRLGRSPEAPGERGRSGPGGDPARR